MSNNSTVFNKLLWWLIGGLAAVLMAAGGAFYTHTVNEFAAIRQDLYHVRQHFLTLDRLARVQEERLAEVRLWWPELTKNQAELSKRLQWLEWYLGQAPDLGTREQAPGQRETHP